MRFVPHEVPSATAAPESTQTEAPVEQFVVPEWQGFAAGVQARFAKQARQDPPLQTWSTPQVVPSAIGVGGAVLSTHTEAPVAQLVTPATQGFGGVQARPVVQPTQTPALQTWLVPQEEPSATLPESTQVAVPDPHCTVAMWQGFVETQGVPQATDWKSQAPLTCPRVPQAWLRFPRVAAAPASSAAFQVGVHPTKPIPSVSKATVTSCVVPSAQVTFQRPLVPQKKWGGVVAVSSATLVRNAKAGVSGGVGVQVVAPDVRGEGRVMVPERR